MPAIALFQPDIPGNAGACIRLCACLGWRLHIIEPCGFIWDERRMQRAVMDYYQLITVHRHDDWPAFKRAVTGRLCLLTTQAHHNYTQLRFDHNDILLAGRESSGVPDDIHAQADQRLAIPMPGGGRSLNVVNALSMVSGEVMRQLYLCP